MTRFNRNDLTVPNVLTLFRILMALVAGGFFLYHRGEAYATLLCIVASILDYFDGWYARRFRQSTKLGTHLDPFADKVLISVVFVSLSLALQWLWFTFFVGIILLRELTITIHRVLKRKKSGVFVPASNLGKIKTMIQCVVGDSILFYVFIHPGKIPGNGWLVFFAMMITLFVTIDSGMRYLLPSCSDGKKRSVLERFCQWIFGIKAREV
jgi:CDP-diacylglycerol--glycerol-3-phosphate 3-phosphatidyltransferase